MHERVGPGGLGTRELVLPLTIPAGELAPSPHLKGMVPVEDQTHIQGFELTHPSIYPICDLPECKKGPILWNHNCRSA